jgi:hypothetical protein
MKQLMPIGIIILVGGLGFLVGLGSVAILAGLSARRRWRSSWCSRCGWSRVRGTRRRRCSPTR